MEKRKEHSIFLQQVLFLHGSHAMQVQVCGTAPGETEEPNK